MVSLDRLHFSIGPVQGSVTQSRRTRDLWMSSFLLSHLAQAAMDAVKSSGGTIILPADPGPASDTSPEGPPHGNVPNRFVAKGADLARAANRAEEEFRQRWKAIADAVWEEFVGPVAGLGNGTQTIWDRQVDNFWELTWVIGGANEDPLPRRKNWRTTPATVEPGDHCTMMGQWQELSGFIRSIERNQQDAFWQALRKQARALDLDNDDERLCAIALIKRLAPRVSEKAFGQKFRAENWPSTPYLAAIPWLRKIGEAGSVVLDEARTYAEAVREVAKQPLGERYTRIKGLVESAQANAAGDLFRLDGNFFHQRALANARVTPLKASGEEEQGQTRERLLKHLSALSKKPNAPASSFYALLLMDGDSMGALLGQARQQGKEAEATGALSRFAGTVPSIVHEHDGITVYAGGDDLLALLAYDRALACAETLCDEYRQSFQPCGDLIAGRATLSGALLYCDYQLPLRTVLKSAHDLLDHVAKDATGRDSLAVGVWKGSGLAARWAAPWQHLRRADGNLLHQLAAKISIEHGKNGAGRAAGFSSSFLYRLRELFASLTDDPLEMPGSFGNILEAKGLDLPSLLLAEHLRGLAHRLSPEEAERLRNQAENDIQLLLKACFRVTRKDGSSLVHNGTKGAACQVGFDGVRVAHFLAALGSEAES